MLVGRSTRDVRFLVRRATTFLDPFAAKDPDRPFDDEVVRHHNRLKGYNKRIGDDKKGLADDTSVHPFGDLRINFVRLNPYNLCFWWEYDFTGGQILHNGRNALLSNSIKKKIYNLHRSNPEEWSVQRLAENYAVRQQRIMAILSLKQAEERDMGSLIQRQKYTGIDPPSLMPDDSQHRSDDASPTDQDVDDAEAGQDNPTPVPRRPKKSISDEQWYDLCDWAEEHVFNATAQVGSGERHFVSVPTYPKFEAIPLSEAVKYDQTEWSISRVNRMYTAKEDKFQIRDFQERLLIHTGKLGRSLDLKTDRRKWHRSPPKHPSPILVTSLDEDVRHPYVAEPDGKQRKLTEDEFLIWKRSNTKIFTKLVGKQIEKENEKRSNVG